MNLDEIKIKISELEDSLEIIKNVYDKNAMMAEKNKLLAEQAEPQFYSDLERVQKVGKRISVLDKKIEALTNVESSLEAIREIAFEAQEGDSLLNDVAIELGALAPKIEEMRLTALLRGKYDRLGAILSVQAGAGGTEAQDWAEMLLRMYTRFCEKMDFDCATLDYTVGDGAGIKGATIKIDGENAYGFLKAEKGVHRLVRISPFDSNSRRHTSFASIEVLPQIENDSEIVIDEKDLKIDTFHAGGHGGQGVNTTDSAVRIRHIPTGIVVQCQNERSQTQNKEYCLKILRAKLAEIKEEEFQKNVQAVQGSLKKIEWGSQIRSYVFCPYTLVKDHRTEYETPNVESVMDGNIQDFILEYLKKGG